MPGQKNVGSVSVRVVPDTTGFAAKLKAELSKIGDLKIKVTPELDDAKLRAQLAALSNKNLKIPAQVNIDQSQLGRALAKKPIKVPAQVDVDQNELARAVAKLKKVHIPADVDTKSLTSLVSKAFAGIKPEHVPVEVDIDKSSIDRILEPLNRTHKLQVQVEANIDRGLLQAQAENLKLKADFEIEQASFRKAQADVEAGFRKFDAIKLNPDIDRSRINKGFSDIKSVGSSVFSALGTAGSNAAANISDAFSGLSGAAGPLGALLKVSAIASAIAVGGAAITAAWGAASTAVAAVPAAIGLIGAPLAAVLVGMDGIKKAAKTLKPEFDALQKSVSATFERGLLPVFQQLKPLFPVLTTGLNQIASSLTSSASKLTSFLTSAQGTREIATLFTNVANAINQTGPGIQALADGFLKLAGNQAALAALTTTINELGVQTQAIADNPALDQAFKGLEGTLKAVTKGFGDLVNNGIKLFAAAAPGVNAVVESITGFFNSFNWDSLGTSVSGVFQGISDAIKSIDLGTIKAIETSFAGLANVFKDPAFQANIKNIASALPALVNQISAMTKDFAGFASEGANFLKFFDDANTKFQDFQTNINTWATSAGDDLQGLIDKFIKFGNDLGASLGTLPETFDRLGAEVHDGVVSIGPAAAQGLDEADLPGKIRTATENLGPTLKTNLDPLPAIARTSVQPVVPAVETGVRGIIPAIRAGTAGAPEALATGLAGLVTGATATAAKVPPAILTPIEILAQKIPVPARAIGESFGTNASSSILAGLALASSSVDQGFVPMAGASTTGVQNMVNAVNAAFPGLGTAIQGGMTALGPLVTAGFLPVQTAFTTAFQTMASVAVPIGMLAIGTAFTAGFTALATTVVAGFLPIQTAFTTAFQTLASVAVPIGMLAIQTAFTAGFAAISALMPTLFLPIQTAFVTAFQTLASVAVPIGMLAIQTAVTAGMVAVALAFTTGFVGVNAAVTAAMIAVAAAFTAGFVTINAAITAGMVAATAAMTAGFVGFTAAVTAGMVLATTEVTTGMTNMTTEVTTGGTNMVTAIKTAMTNFVTEVKTGMTNALTAVKTGIADIIAALKAAAGPAKDAGVALGQGFVNGIKSQEGAARAAGVALGQAAVDGMNSVKGINSGSPSKKGIASGVNLGGSMVIGMDRMQAKVFRAGADLGATAADGMNSAFDATFLNANGILSDLDTRIRAEVNSGSFDTSSGSSTPVILHNVFQVGTEAVEEIFRELSREQQEDLLLKLRAA